ncbi:MAG: protein kinase, partial [archaeon]|nr:protein kinase [archaeon]
EEKEEIEKEENKKEEEENENNSVRKKINFTEEIEENNSSNSQQLTLYNKNIHSPTSGSTYNTKPSSSSDLALVPLENKNNKLTKLSTPEAKYSKQAKEVIQSLSGVGAIDKVENKVIGVKFHHKDSEVKLTVYTQADISVKENTNTKEIEDQINKMNQEYSDAIKEKKQSFSKNSSSLDSLGKQIKEENRIKDKSNKKTPFEEEDEEEDEEDDDRNSTVKKESSKQKNSAKEINIPEDNSNGNIENILEESGDEYSGLKAPPKVSEKKPKKEKKKDKKKKEKKLRREIPQEAIFVEQGKSRIEKDFEDFDILGKGGFGLVLKAKHKIDDGIYALKIINLEDENIQEVVSEAKTMTKIKYKHIVDFKTCWYENNLEPFIKKFSPAKSAQSSIVESGLQNLSQSMEKSKYSLSRSYNEYNNQLISGTSSKKKDDSVSGDIIFEEDNKSEENQGNGIIFEEGNDEPENQDSGIIFEEDNKSDENQEDQKISKKEENIKRKKSKNYFNKSIYGDANSDEEGISRRTRKMEKPLIRNYKDDSYKYSTSKRSLLSRKSNFMNNSIYFVIQMEYCAGISLDEYISNNNENGIDKKIIFRFIYQILKALRQIHSRGIIHRDIKPANIFLMENEKNDIKIGDFGLAISGIGGMVDPNECAGTPLYMSPEQIGKKNYNEKVDIYACGIIMFELCGCFATFMERRQSIVNLRDNGIIADTLKDKYPLETELIKIMTQNDPDQRPSAVDLLESELFKRWKEESTEK